MSSPNMPKTIKVGPYRYSVVSDRAAMNEACRAAQSARIGETDYDKQIITIDPSLHEDSVAEALLHEVMHIIQSTVGIGANDKIRAHEYIYRVAATLLAVLRENPDLVSLLVGDSG